MYFINSGKIIVEKGGKEVDAKYEGTYFGELGLMFSDGLLELRQADFFGLIETHPPVASVLYENMSDVVSKMRRF
jgi:hypothetical protein